MKTVNRADMLLQKGIKQDYELSMEFAILLGDIQRIAHTTPAALTSLRNKYSEKYYLLQSERNKYAS